VLRTHQFQQENTLQGKPSEQLNPEEDQPDARSSAFVVYTNTKNKKPIINLFLTISHADIFPQSLLFILFSYMRFAHMRSFPAVKIVYVYRPSGITYSNVPPFIAARGVVDVSNPDEASLRHTASPFGLAMARGARYGISA
jgi:hypothetical protein